MGDCASRGRVSRWIVLVWLVIPIVALGHVITGVGFAAIRVHDPVNGGNMSGYVFYPSAKANGVTWRGAYELDATPNAAAIPGAKPLVMISHGHGGSDLGHHDLATYLASHGFIVAAITHPKDNFRNSSGDGHAVVLVGRPIQISAAISYLLQSPRWAPLIDPSRIGVAGFSNGGYTALLLAGAVPQFTRVVRHCRLHPDDRNVCTPLAKLEAEAAQHGRTIEQTISALQRSLHRWGNTDDPRVKAAFVMAPFSSVFDAAGLAHINRPVFLYYAQDDHVLLPRYNALHIAPLIKTLVGLKMIPNAGHYVFLSPCSRELARDYPDICKDPPGVDRVAVHRQINVAALAFYRKALDVTPH
jgi:predicted dienelactone hydrolase